MEISKLYDIHRLNGAELIRVNEGEEPNDLCCLLGNRKDYITMINGTNYFYQLTWTIPACFVCLLWHAKCCVCCWFYLAGMLCCLPDTRFRQFTPRLFALSSTTGEYSASEVLYPARTEAEAFTFDQGDLYSANQPGR